jgi:hypothetical protein
MRENPSEHPSRPKRKKRSTSPLPYFLFFCVIVAALFFYFKYQENVTIKSGPPEQLDKKQTISEASTSAPATVESGLSGDISVDSPAIDISATNESVESTFGTITEETANDQEDISLTETEEENTKDLQSESTPEASLQIINNFYTHLDQQQYIKSFQIPAPSEAYFSALIQKILNTPPIVSGETRDLFNILKNTAHFFRIVGKNNIQAMKAILDQEKDSFEEVLAEYYRLTAYPDYLKSNFALDVSEESIYDYAGFFLTTMGGRLYLFRRDSVSRMVISYYSILIVDKANKEGRNSHGIDIRPAVETLIQELEINGTQLRLKDTYIDTLYNLKEKYM